MSKAKAKTHRGTAKRFSRTASGRVKCRRAFRNHILTKKTTKQKRGLRTGSLLSKVDQVLLKYLLP